MRREIQGLIEAARKRAEAPEEDEVVKVKAQVRAKVNRDGRSHLSIGASSIHWGIDAFPQDLSVANYQLQKEEQERCDDALSVIRESRGRGTIYVIRPKGLSVVKIGTCLKVTPHVRLKCLQTSWPIDLEIAASVGNINCDIEVAVHGFFCDYQLRGEWFQLNPTLAQFTKMCVSLAKVKDRGMIDFVRRKIEGGAETYARCGRAPTEPDTEALAPHD